MNRTVMVFHFEFPFGELSARRLAVHEQELFIRERTINGSKFDYLVFAHSRIR